MENREQVGSENPRGPTGEVEQNLMIAARDVLSTMFYTDVVDEELGPAEPSGPPAENTLTVSVSFSGDARGSLRLLLEEQTAGSLAASFLGAGPGWEPTSKEVDDVIAELGNMVCGAFLSRQDLEGLFALSVPSIKRPGPLTPFCLELPLEEGILKLGVEIEGSA